MGLVPSRQVTAHRRGRGFLAFSNLVAPRGISFDSTGMRVTRSGVMPMGLGRLGLCVICLGWGVFHCSTVPNTLEKVEQSQTPYKIVLLSIGVPLFHCFRGGIHHYPLRQT